ncbi:MAG TPA: mesaconyl-C4 CoA hydratase [Galbitalea sp.]|jgi:3-methylfumaryl-CoA hydratase|nr:mesaconyl-C4 CoA hydratase [Galbitalea sp.]
MSADELERTGQLHSETLAEAAALLSLDQESAWKTDGIPLLWHWFFLLENPREDELGADGHPAQGIPTPPFPGAQRLFAGGRVTRLAPLRVDAPATRRTRLARWSEKTGKSGSFFLATVVHEITQSGKVVVHEEQELVYRARGANRHEDAAQPLVPISPEEWSVPIDPVYLFRFSALTHNSHRIHYDGDFARRVEGHPGLVVHGPLQALLMTEYAARLGEIPAACTLDYRLTAPLYLGEGLIVGGTRGARSTELSVRNDHGVVTARGILRDIEDGDIGSSSE